MFNLKSANELFHEVILILIYHKLQKINYIQ